ncbi:MAG: nicotinate phosphoribosyltransferase [Actinomycetota bacterium]|nr:nicotinate phosphoribosyltransferase [Actinomycetota bacterium]
MAGGDPVGSTVSSALLTDRYELTMLDAALRSGAASRPATFEVFSRRLGAGRTHGVVGGIDGVLEAVERFRFGPAELAWLEAASIVSAPTLAWLADYRFSGSIDAYPEGELYTVGSPILTVEGTFGEAVLLETIVLSILNHDSAIASAAQRIVAAAGGRPIIEMGGRRVSPEAAVAAARAAYLAGFASTSNLEAGRRHGIPTAGTAAHAFVLAYASEAEAFAAQIAAGGVSTTLLVDTYDIEGGIRAAVEVAGPELGAVRIDSGDLVDEAWRARALLDSLGATRTRVIITGDLDDVSIAALADAPVDSYGVGTRVVTGLDQPTAGFVYKLVSVAAGSDEGDPQHAVAKSSPGKATVGGRKWAWRTRLEDLPESFDGPDVTGGPVQVDVITDSPEPPPGEGRPLQRRMIDQGQVTGREPLLTARRRCEAAVAEAGGTKGLIAVRGTT